MRLSEILSGKPDRLVTLPPTASVLRAALQMKLAGVGAIVVCDPRGRVLGLCSERDLVVAAASTSEEFFGRSIGDVMTVDIPTTTPNTPVQSVMRIMIEQRARHLPVVEDGIAVGVVSLGDVLKSRLAEKTLENAVLQDMARAHMAA